MSINVLVEIPKGSKQKYEYDEKLGAIKLDRVLYSSVYFPFEYGSIKGTLAEDGDPLDVVLLASFPSFPGCIVEAEIVGLLEMEDEAGIDTKIIAVPTEKIDPRWAHIKDIADMNACTKEEIKEFFETYKRLEPNKWVKLKDFKGKQEAEKMIKQAKENFNNK
jgi:inorganic pyrophosphatase